MNKIITLMALAMVLFGNAQAFINGNIYGGTGIQAMNNSFSDSSGNIYAVGLYNTTFDFGSHTYTPFGGNADGVLAKFDADGNQLEAYVFGGGADDVVSSGVTDSEGNIYLTGYFQGAGALSFDADPSPDSQYLLGNLGALLSRDAFIIKLNAEGHFVFAKQISNTLGASQEDAMDIELDAAGNIYLCGRFSQADFDPDPDSEYLVQTTSGQFEGFILKLNAAGEFQWVKHIRDAKNEVNDLSIDADGNLIATGTFGQTVSIDGEATLTSTANGDTYVIRYDSDGNFINALSFGGSDNVEGDKIQFTSDGFLVAGVFTGIADFNPTSVCNEFTSNGSQDIYISKFDSDFNYINSYVFGGSEFDDLISLQLDALENIYLSGYYQGEVAFNSIDNSNSSTSAGYRDHYVLELLPVLEYENHVTLEGSGDASSGAMVLNGNKIAFTGNFKSEIDLDPYSTEYIESTNAIYKGFLSLFTMNNLGVEDVDNKSEISIFPNPAHDFIQVSAMDKASYVIYDAQGKSIQNGELLPQGSIEIQKLPKGVYILQLNGKENLKTFQFIKK